MPAHLPEKAHGVRWSDLIGALIFAISAHLLFFSLLTPRIPMLKTQTRTEAAFLGAILDPFEAKTLNSEGTLVTDISAILKKTDQKAGLNATSQNKPNFTKGINAHSKNLFKSAPLIETPVPKLPPEEIKNTPGTEVEPPPYQRLRLTQ